MNRTAVRKRFWIEFGCAALGSFLILLTLFTRDWIEVLFDFDPDNGSGAAEVGLAVSLLMFTLCSAFVARREWRRPVAA